MGLIDVLTQYDTKKKAAHAAKTVKHGVSYIREKNERRSLKCRRIIKCLMYTDDADDLSLLFVFPACCCRPVLKSPQSTLSNTQNVSVTSSQTFLHNMEL